MYPLKRTAWECTATTFYFTAATGRSANPYKDRRVLSKNSKHLAKKIQHRQGEHKELTGVPRSAQPRALQPPAPARPSIRWEPVPARGPASAEREVPGWASRGRPRAAQRPPRPPRSAASPPPQPWRERTARLATLAGSG